MCICGLVPHLKIFALVQLLVPDAYSYGSCFLFNLGAIFDLLLLYMRDFLLAYSLWKGIRVQTSLVCVHFAL